MIQYYPFFNNQLPEKIYESDENCESVLNDE